MAIGFRAINGDLGWPEAGHGSGDIVQVDCGWRTGWQLTAEYEHPGGDLWVIFSDPVSYRVHDERELLPYWEQLRLEAVSPSCAYEIAESDYLAEMRRGISGLTEAPLRHILISSQNICLEVITTQLPSLSATQPAPVESVEAWQQLRETRLNSVVK